MREMDPRDSKMLIAKLVVFILDDGEIWTTVQSIAGDDRRQ